MAEHEYDPHLYREVAKPLKSYEALFHMLKGCLGTGILAMPEAFKLAGMYNGIISTLLIGALSTYCLHILVGGQYLLCKKLKVALLTYPESMKVACELGPRWLRPFANYSPGITNFFLVVFQVGTCCVYVVFVGKNLKYLGDLYTEIGLMYYMLMMLIPCILLISVRNLKLLAPFSILANIITFMTFGVVCYYVCQNLPDFRERAALGHVKDYPLFFGTSLFSLQSIAIITSVENSMESPKDFRQPYGVLNIGMVIVTITYVLVAVMGYWRYGEDIQSTVTMNFPLEDVLAQVIILSYVVAITISYGLQGYIPVQIIWSDYISKRVKDQSNSKKLFYEYLLRMSVVAISFILGMTIPLLGYVISLVGALCVSALGITFPALIEICANWPEDSHPKTWMFWKDMMIIFIGMLGLFAGSYAAIYGIIQSLSAEDY